MKTKLFIISTLAIVFASCSVQNKDVKEVADIAVDSQKEALLAQGKTLFETKCNKCHALPKREDFTNEQWKIYVEQMIPKAKITDLKEGLAIRSYLYK